MTDAAPISAPGTNESPAKPTPQKRRRIGRFIWLGFLILLLGAAVAGYFGYQYVTSPQFIRAQAIKALERATGTEVSVGSARFIWGKPIELTDIALQIPGLGEEGEITTIERATVDLDLFGLLTGNTRINRVELYKPVILIVENKDTGKLNLTTLQDQLKKREVKKRPKLEHLPDVTLVDAQVKFASLIEGQLKVNHEQQYNGALSADANQPGYYIGSLVPGDRNSGPELTGGFDLKTGRFNANISRIQVDSPLLSLLPADLQKWWNERQAKGPGIPIDIGYEPDIGWQVTITVDQVELTPPYARAPLRMRAREGHFTIHNHDQLPDKPATIDVKLAGDISGFDYQVEGKITDPFQGNPDVDLDLNIAGKVTPEPGFLQYLEPEVRKPVEEFITDYRPDGNVKAEVDLLRDSKTGKLTYTADVKLSDVTGRYIKFDYPLTDVTADLVFTPERIDIKTIAGIGPSGAKINITGRVINPGPTADTQIHITSDNLPIDDHLRNGMEPEDRQWLDMFRSETHLADLRQRKLIASETSPKQEHAEEAREPLPDFRLGGKARVAVDVKRYPTDENRWETSININMAGLGIIFQDWPYPVVAESGDLYIQSGNIEVKDVTLKGLSGATLTVNGKLEPKAEDLGGRALPDIQVTGRDIPIDEYLLFTIPKEDAGFVRDLGVDQTARASAKGRIFADEQGHTVYDVAAKLNDGKAVPNQAHGGKYALGDIQAEVRFRTGQVDIEKVTASHDKARFTATGKIETASEPRHFELDVEAVDVAIQDGVIDLTPRLGDTYDRTKTFYETYKPAGIAKGTLHYATGREEAFLLTIIPADLAFDMTGQRIELTDVAGKIAIDGTHANLEKVSGTFSKGKLKVDGRISLHEEPDLDLIISAESKSIDKKTRAFLPPQALAVLDSLDIEGAYKVDEAKLVYRPRASKGLMLSFAGIIGLEKGKANLGIPLTDIEGALSLSVTQEQGKDYPKLKGHLFADSLRAQERLVSKANVHFDNEASLNVVEVNKILGRLYNGSVTGTARVTLGEKQNSYQTEMTLQEVDLMPAIDPKTEDKWQANRQLIDAIKKGEKTEDDAKPQQYGQLSARLMLEGVVGEEKSRRGRGSIFIRDAHLYEFPVGMAALQVMNLQLPASSSFDQVRSSFRVEGNTIHVDDLRLQAPTIEMAGNGKIDWQNFGLDLKLESRSTGKSVLGPFQAIWNKLQSELFTIEIKGTVEKPKIGIKPFKSSRSTWKDIVGEKKD